MLVQFSEEQCVLVEKGSHGVVYRITFYPTDTEWVCFLLVVVDG